MRGHQLLSAALASFMLSAVGVLASSACSVIPPEPTPTRQWATYVNENYNFSLDYPQDVLLEAASDGPFQVVVYTDPQRPFYLRATRDYLPNDLVYFLDTPASGALSLGAYRWQAYVLPDGYGDAVGTSPPIYALQMEMHSVLYSALFFDQDSLDQLQLDVLSTFRVLE